MLIKVKNQTALKGALDKIRGFLEAEGATEDALFRSKFVLSEIVGNVFKHSQAFAEVESRISDGFVELTVRASDGYLPPKQSVCSDVYEEGGRGLFLVDAVCSSRESTKQGLKIRIRIDEP